MIHVRVPRFVRRALLAAAAVMVVTVAWIGWEFILTRGHTPPQRIGSDPIAVLEEVEIGGVRQWVLIRGHDRTNPVILFLHGGPGMPMMYLAHAFQRELEEDFVVVHWDRRGAGKSFDALAPGGELPVTRVLEDTYELTRMLRDRFEQERIYLVGHSWGSYLGLLAARAHPEWYHAFVGMGQLAGTREGALELRRDFVSAAARAAGEEDYASRVASGEASPTEDDLFRFGGQLRGATSLWPILRTGLAAPEYTLFDALNVRKGAVAVARATVYDVEPVPLQGEVERLEIPVGFFLGRFDYNTPSKLAADYLGRLDAPSKTLIWFEDSAHFPFWEESQRFAAEMSRLHQHLTDAKKRREQLF